MKTHRPLAIDIGFLLFLLFALLGCSQGTVQETEQTTSYFAGPKVNWDFSIWGAPRPGTKSIDSLAEHVKKHTDGNWTITVHYGEALSKTRENLDGISIGAFESALVCNFYHPQKNPGLMVLSLPFLPIKTWEDGLAVREAVHAHDQVKKEMKRWGAMIYSSTNIPSYEIMGRGKPPLTLEDWKGLNVRAGGGLGDLLTKIGAVPTSTTATEVYTGIQLGTMDAAAFPFTYAHVSYRLHEVSDWFTSNMSPGTADCPIVFSIPAYEKLPQQYKDLLVEIKDSIAEDQRIAYEEIDRVNLPMLKENLQEIRYTEEELEEFRTQYANLVIEDWIEKNERSFDARGLVETVFSAVGQEYP